MLSHKNYTSLDSNLETDIPSNYILLLKTLISSFQNRLDSGEMEVIQGIEFEVESISG